MGWIVWLLIVFLVFALLLILLDLKLRAKLKKIRLVDASRKDLPEKMPILESPLIFMFNFIYNGFVTKKSDHVVFLEKAANFKSPLKTYANSFLGIPTIVTWNPEFCNKLFKDKDSWGKNNTNFVIFMELMGESVVSVEGEHWKSQRRILNPSFSTSYMKKLFPAFLKIADSLIDRLDEYEKEGHFEPSNWMSKATLDSLGKAGFGLDFDSLNHRMSEVYRAYEGILKGLVNPLKLFPWFNSLPLSSNKNYNAAKENFWKWSGVAIDEKRKNISSNSESVRDILDALVSSRFEESEDGYQLSDKELLQNVFLFFLAGHETTSGTLTFVLDMLARHPEIQERCRKEITDIFNGEEPSEEKIKELSFLNNVIQETLRMRSPVISLAREAKQDCELGGYFIPKGTLGIAVIANLHHDPDVWEEPMRFNPDRWNDSPRKGISFMPFGAGARLCLGMNFANLEMRTILVKLLQRYEFGVYEDVKLVRGITTRPQDNYKLKIKRI